MRPEAIGGDRARSKAPRCLAVALILTLAFGAWSPAPGQDVRPFDQVWLKGGGKALVGTIESEPDDPEVVLRQRNGIVGRWPRDQVARVVRSQTPKQAYKAESSKIKDAVGRARLARFCVDYELYSEAWAELRLGVEADPTEAEVYALAATLFEEQVALPKTAEPAIVVQEREALVDTFFAVAEQARVAACWTPRLGLAQARACSIVGLKEGALGEYRRVITALTAEGVSAPGWMLEKALAGAGQAELDAGRGAEALGHFEALAERAPQSFVAAAGVARSTQLVGDLEASESEYSRALGLEPAVVELYAERASVRVGLGRLVEARGDLERALKLGGADPRGLHTQLGIVSLREGRLKSAATSFLETRGETLFAPAEAGLALVRLRRGDAIGALADLDRALGLAPGDPVLEALRGRVLSELGRSDEARIAYRAALKGGFAAAVGVRALADVASARGDAARAEQLMRYLATSERRGTADDLYALGRLMLKGKNSDAARELFERALRLEQNHLLALCGLGYLAYQSGDYPEASKLFKQVLGLEAEHPYARRALRNVEESKTRKVWIDAFDRKGPGVANRWESSSSFGVAVELRDGRVLFEGTQRNEEMGKTELHRKVDDGELVRFEAHFATAKIGAARVGIRLRVGSNELIVFRSLDGRRVMGAVLRGKTAATPVELGSWPDDTGIHVLAIEAEELSKGIIGVCLDGERLGQLKARAVRRLKGADVVIYGQAAVGEAWRLEIEKVRIFVKKGGKTKKQGGL